MSFMAILPEITSAKLLLYLQCVNYGDITVLLQAIDFLHH